MLGMFGFEALQIGGAGARGARTALVHFDEVRRAADEIAAHRALGLAQPGVEVLAAGDRGVRVGHPLCGFEGLLGHPARAACDADCEKKGE